MQPETVGGVINCVAYAKGRRVADVKVEDISEVLKQPDVFVWLGLREPGPELLQTVQREFGLPSDSRMLLSLEIFNAFNFDNVEIGSANMTYGPGTVLSNGVLVSQDPPATFGQIHDANGNYLTNSTLRSAPFQVQLGVRFQF